MLAIAQSHRMTPTGGDLYKCTKVSPPPVLFWLYNGVDTPGSAVPLSNYRRCQGTGYWSSARRSLQ